MNLINKSVREPTSIVSNTVQSFFLANHGSPFLNKLTHYVQGHLATTNSQNCGASYIGSTKHQESGVDNLTAPD